MTTPSSPKMPVLFIGHGSPMNALEENRFSEAWHTLNAVTPTPRAIVVVSAHWETAGACLTANEMPPTIHDFRGFPEALFNMHYPCPGAPELARQIQELAAEQEISLDQHWGLDHGSWSVLVHLYPDATIPVLQLSLDTNRSPADHYRLAQALAPLRDQGMLFIGSGNIVHNIERWLRYPDGPFDWARDFNRHVCRAVETRDHDALLHYSRWQPEASLAVPTDEHYLPLVYCLGISAEEDRILFSDFGESDMESCSMTSIAWIAA